MIMIGCELVLALHGDDWGDRVMVQTICGMHRFLEDRSWKVGEIPRTCREIVFRAQVSEHLFHVAGNDMSLRQLEDDLESYMRSKENKEEEPLS